MSEAQEEVVVVDGDSPEGREADKLARRMWYAVATPGVEISQSVLMMGVSLYLAKLADTYLVDADDFIDELGRIAKDIMAQWRVMRSKGNVQ